MCREGFHLFCEELCGKVEIEGPRVLNLKSRVSFSRPFEEFRNLSFRMGPSGGEHRSGDDDSLGSFFRESIDRDIDTRRTEFILGNGNLLVGETFA